MKGLLGGGTAAVLTGYTVLFPLAFRAALPRGTQGWWAALAAFPFVHAYPFHMGFWLSGYLAEFVSAEGAVEEERVLLPLASAPQGPRDADGIRLGYRVKPFLHAAGWIVADRGGVDGPPPRAAEGPPPRPPRCSMRGWSGSSSCGPTAPRTSVRWRGS